MKAIFLLVAAYLLILVLPVRAQQIVCERLLSTPGLEVRWPTACSAPNGEFIVTGAVRPVGAVASGLATHTFVARLQAGGCDTLWTRRLAHATVYYALSAATADAKGIWLLTSDTVVANSIGVRLWRLNTAGRVRRKLPIAPRSPQEHPTYLLPAADGGVYAQTLSQSLAVGGKRAPAILRFDSMGTVRWRRDYGYAANYYGNSLCYTPTGHVLLTGMVGVGANYDGHAKLLEVETNRGDSLRGTTLPWGA
jgi:hypothetical protein